jgi:Tol biopolymer transport system component
LLYVHYPQTLDELLMGTDRQIWLYDQSTGTKRFVVAGLSPIWMPDNSTFIYTSQSGVARCDLGAGISTTLFACGDPLLARPSPDGQTISCDSNCQPAVDNGIYIWLVDLASGHSHCVGQQGMGSWRSAAWSPDGSRLAHVRYALPNGPYQLFVMDTSGTNATRLWAETDFDDFDPTWSHDGDWIYFTRYGNQPPSQAGVWRIHPDGTSAQLIVPGGSNPSCSPLDTALVFGYYDPVTNSFDVWTSHADGSMLRRVFDEPATLPSTAASWRSTPRWNSITPTRR